MQALAAQVLLARQGYPACLCIGVARDENARLRAHAWVASQSSMVIGGGDVSSYTLLSVWESTGS